MKSLRAAVFGLILAAAMTGGASAQPKGEGRSAIVQQLADCRKLTDDGARLACFDRTAETLDQAEAKGDIVVVDRDQVRAVRRQAFGFTLPSLTLFDRSGEAGAEMDAVTLKVEAAQTQADGKWVLKLEGGQVWRQIDTAVLARPPKVGGAVTIKRAMMGSFKLTTGSGGAIRVRREN